jgi:hypothetical protein
MPLGNKITFCFQLSSYLFDNVFSLVKFICSDEATDVDVDQHAMVQKELDLLLQELLALTMNGSNAILFSIEVVSFWEAFSSAETFNTKNRLSGK